MGVLVLQSLFHLYAYPKKIMELVRSSLQLFQAMSHGPIDHQPHRYPFMFSLLTLLQTKWVERITYQARPWASVSCDPTTLILPCCGVICSAMPFIVAHYHGCHLQWQMYLSQGQIFLVISMDTRLHTRYNVDGNWSSNMYTIMPMCGNRVATCIK